MNSVCPHSSLEEIVMQIFSLFVGITKNLEHEILIVKNKLTQFSCMYPKGGCCHAVFRNFFIFNIGVALKRLCLIV